MLKIILKIVPFIETINVNKSSLNILINKSINKKVKKEIKNEIKIINEFLKISKDQCNNSFCFSLSDLFLSKNIGIKFK